MDIENIKEITERTDRYNFHSHSEFCDGHAPIASIAEAASEAGFEVWGVTPHSPICIDSPCNMLKVDVEPYLSTMDELKERFAGRLQLITGMEVDFISRDFGPHIDYFQNMPLEYRIGSVHFVPTQDGIPLDCDGSSERFATYLDKKFKSDLRYVVEKYFEQVLTMLELGGFEILGHFDKIIGNACTIDENLESYGWYASLVEDVVRLAKDTDVAVEINTKAIEKKGRFFPSEIWWPRLIKSGMQIVINSDCHDPKLTDLGREEAFKKLQEMGMDYHRR